LEHGDIEMGHARALLSLSGDEQTLAAKQVVSQNLSVRQTEQFVRNLHKHEEAKAKPEEAKKSPRLAALEASLQHCLGERAVIKSSSTKRGKIIISYNSVDDLQQLVDKLTETA